MKLRPADRHQGGLDDWGYRMMIGLLEEVHMSSFYTLRAKGRSRLLFCCFWFRIHMSWMRALGICTPTSAYSIFHGSYSAVKEGIGPMEVTSAGAW